MLAEGLACLVHQVMAMRAASATTASGSAFVPVQRHRDLPFPKEKAPEDLRGFCCDPSVAYFSEELIEPNLVFSVEPRLLTTVMMASAMPAAIRPYSMAVAPDSSFAKRAIRFFMNKTPSGVG